MKIKAIRFLVVAANPRVRMILFLFGNSLVGGALWSIFPGPPGVLFLIISLLISAVVLTINSVSVGFALFGKRWRLAGERIMLLFVAFPVMFLSILSADHVHVAILYPYYIYKIALTSERPVRFYWGDGAMTALDGFSIRTLLYEEAGKTTITTVVQRDDQSICTERHSLMWNFSIETVWDCR